MNFSMTRDHKKASLIAAILLSSGFCPSVIHQAAATEPHLEKAIRDGEALFVHETFGGAGNTCQTCHVEGGAGPGKSGKGDAIPSLANAATIFPRFNPKANKVETLEDKIGHCIAGALQGKPPAYGSEQMTQLVSYITSLAQGKPLNMGGKPQ
ncbi:MAG: c-type cytochrome [Bradyrhizobium sp.]|nr:c-type cytochrome [Bradyrhizobium sp.]